MSAQSGGSTVLGLPGSGAGQTSLQRAYENSGGVNPMIQLDTSDGTLTIRDDATPLADMFELQNNAGVGFFDVDADVFEYGLDGNKGYSFALDPTGRESIRFLPDGRTQTTTASPGGFMMQWDSLVVADIPGGAPFGNDTAPAGMGMIGECRFDDPGNLFSSALTFNQATIMTANGVNVGPVYTMVNQPLLRTGTLGGSRSFSQANAVRSQLRVGPNLAGNVTLTSHEPFFATVQVNATVGTATVTTVNYFAAKAPALTAGGTIGTLNCFDIVDIPAGGISTLRGINSAMTAGVFINHSGTAPSDFSGNIRFSDGVGNIFGSSLDAIIDWQAAGYLRFFFFANSDDIRWSNGVNGQILADCGASEFTLNTERGFIFGDQTSVLGNQFGLFVQGPYTQGAAGEVNIFQLTQSGNLTVNQANTVVRNWTLAPTSITLSGPGTVTDHEVFRIQGNPGTATVNRVGLRIVSNPSGGSGVNAALWCENGDAVFDGRVDINNGVALGGGASATLGTIGGSGPTTAAQAQWVEIDIGGVPHWIPVWT